MNIQQAMNTVGLAAFLTAASITPLAAQDNESLFGIDAPSVTYGPYITGGLGFESSMINDGFWESPGPSDPLVLFDLDSDNAVYGKLGVGFDWMNGFRGDVSLSVFGDKDVSGPWSSTIPPSPGPHASVSTSVSAMALMGNIYYAPWESLGKDSTFTPYVMAGLGFSRNEMSDWTRTNLSAGRPTRSFEGATNTELVWSVGVGGSWQIERQGKRPMFLDAGVQYFDLGDAQGGAQPLPRSGTSTPRQPLTVGMESTVVSIGLRIPLNW